VIQAACTGNLGIFQTLLISGCHITDVGHITLSKKRRNDVGSNVLGAAAFHGNAELLKYALTRIDHSFLNVASLESIDSFGANKKASPFTPELQGYTPLMLAVASPKANLECVKILLSQNADQKCREAQTDNSLLHLCAKYSTKNEIMEYIVKNLKLNLFERNKNGDTPISICEANKNVKSVKLLEKYQA